MRRFVVPRPIFAPDHSGPDYDPVVEDVNAPYSFGNFLTKVAPAHSDLVNASAHGRIVAEGDVVVE